jgi:putative ABC transport system substrate-binding protein
LTQTTTATDTHVWDGYIAAFTGALCTNGSLTWVPPQTGSDYNSYLIGAQNLMRGGANVIVTAGNVAAKACYDATKNSTTAVVVASAGDLTGLTGGNLTGCTNGQFDQQIVQERINIMQQWNPTGVGVVGNYSVPPVGKAMDYVKSQLGGNTQIVDLNPTNIQTLQTTLTNLKQQYNVNVLYVCSDPYLRTNGNNLIQAAHGHALGMKTMHEFGEWVTYHRGNQAYGPDFTKLFKRAAGYVDQILNGADPANLPIFAPLPVDCVPTISVD